MATFKVTKKTTVAELKSEFQQQVGGLLHVYNGRSEAAEDATLVSLGAKEGVLECRTSRTVGKFEEAFQSELNLKVKVYTKDNWVKVLDGITLATVKDLPNGMTKAKMEEYLAYQRDEETAETVEETKSEEVATSSVEAPDELLYMPIADFEFTKLEMTDDEIEENSDDLDVNGALIIYAYDNDDDFVASAWVGSIYDKLVDDARAWAGQYEGERRLEYFISKKHDTYGFSESMDEDEVFSHLEQALCRYVGDDDYNNWDLDSKLAVRAKWPEKDKTDVFTIKNSGWFDNMWYVTDEEFNELIRMTLAGENVKQFPNVPIFIANFAEIDIDNIKTDLDGVIKSAKDDCGDKFEGLIFYEVKYEDDEWKNGVVKADTLDDAFTTLQSIINENGKELDFTQYAKVLKSHNAFQFDGTTEEALHNIELLTLKDMRIIEEAVNNCIYVYTIRNGRRSFILRYDEDGDVVDAHVDYDEIKEKFGL